MVHVLKSIKSINAQTLSTQKKINNRKFSSACSFFFHREAQKRKKGNKNKTHSNNNNNFMRHCLWTWCVFSSKASKNEICWKIWTRKCYCLHWSQLHLFIHFLAILLILQCDMKITTNSVMLFSSHHNTAPLPSPPFLALIPLCIVFSIPHCYAVHPV